MASTMVGYNPAAIQKMFHDYVEGTGGKPRHTPEANYEVSLYRQFIEGAFPSNSELQDGLFDRMMSCAVEFEESGFIAGFREGFQYAFQFFRIPESPIRLVTIPTLPKEEAPKTGTGVQAAAQNPRNPQADVSPKGAEQNHVDTGEARASATISSKQIAEFFETSNAKVVRRIEDNILPCLDEQSKRFFRLEIGHTPQHRRYRLYHLNKAACDLYLKEMDPHKKYVNIAGGMVKLRKMMETVFPVKASAS